MLLRAFGFNESVHPVIINLAIMYRAVIYPFSIILQSLTIILNKKFELQADSFTKEIGKAKALESALIKLYNDNLTFPVFDYLYSAWYHTHPQLLERLEALSKTD